MVDSSSPEELVGAARTRLAAAPLNGDWDAALAALAQACGGWGASITSMSPRSGLTICFGSGVTDEIVRHFVQSNGFRPGDNARAAAMYAAAPMRPYAEADFIDERAWRSSRYFQEFCAPVGVPHSVFSKLSAGGGKSYFFSVGRTETQGAVTREQRQIFNALLPPLDAALRLNLELETRALSFAALSWDAISAPAYFCGPGMKLFAASAAGERALRDGRFVTLSRGRLRLANPVCHEMAEARVAFACRLHARPSIANLPVTSANGGDSCLLTVAPAPADRPGAPTVPCALVLLLEPSVRTTAPRDVGLTEAEKQIAQGLLDGLTTRAIADSRQVSISTVQTQIKALHHKLQVSHRAELIAALRALIA